MPEQAVANVVEYNKVHALALARMRMIQKFGSSLEHFWPMTDSSAQIRDLLRRRALLATTGVEFQAPGLVDYAVDIGSGYVTDVAPDLGQVSTETRLWGTSYSTAATGCRIPAGVYFQFDYRIHSFLSGQDHIPFIAPWDQNEPDPWSKRILEGPTFSGTGLIQWMLPTPFFVGTDSVFGVKPSNGGQDPYAANTDQGIGIWWIQSGSGWYQGAKYASVKAYGRQAKTWPQFQKLTLGVVVNMENITPGGMLLCLRNSSEVVARISLSSNFEPSGYIKNSGGTTYTLTAAERLHSGHNLITLSYEPSVAVKLGINGKVAQSATPNSSAAFSSQALAVGVGAEVTPGGTASNKSANALIDDVFIASGVVSDDDLWELFLAYITSAPLMQVEEIIKVEVEES